MKIRKLMATAAAVTVASTAVIHGAPSALAQDDSVSSRSSDDTTTNDDGSSNLDDLSSKATGSLPSGLKAIVDYILNFPKIVKAALSSGNSSLSDG